MEKAELKDLLRESTEKVLFELGKILDKNSSLYNELIVLWKRHDDIEREIRLGTIGFQEVSIENNKVTDSLLKLIDEIEKTNIVDITNKNGKKEIPIEDAIEWLKNALKGIGYILKEEEKDDNKKEYSYKSSKIKEVTIDDEGSFYIKDCYEHLIVTYLYSGSEKSKSMDLWPYTINIKGNFRDISSLFIEKNNQYGCYTIRCVATNYEKKFFIKTDDKEGKSESEFYLHTEDINRAKKIKNAIDYLAIYFGRKEDAF